MSHQQWHILFLHYGLLHCSGLHKSSWAAAGWTLEHFRINVKNWTDRQKLEGHKRMLLGNQEHFFLFFIVEYKNKCIE